MIYPCIIFKTVEVGICLCLECNVATNALLYYSFVDTYTLKTYSCKTALQLRVQPGSYKVQPQTVGAQSTIDPQIPNSNLEWCTNHHGSTEIQGVLIKMDKDEVVKPVFCVHLITTT